jgi:hypothetical protein
VSLTFAIAKKAPVGVVIETYTSRLSRMHRWDLETDTFTPGQFLMGRATVEDISPDGRYVVYHATAYHQPVQNYLGVSHVPYFTALAFIEHRNWNSRLAVFREDGALVVDADREPSPLEIDGQAFSGRIDPGCPFPIIAESLWRETSSRERAYDEPRSRWVAVDGDLLVATEKDTKLRKFIAAFRREPFEAVEPPEWATRW